MSCHQAKVFNSYTTVKRGQVCPAISRRALLSLCMTSFPSQPSWYCIKVKVTIGIRPETARLHSCHDPPGLLAHFEWSNQHALCQSIRFMPEENTWLTDFDPPPLGTLPHHQDIGRFLKRKEKEKELDMVAKGVECHSRKMLMQQRPRVIKLIRCSAGRSVTELWVKNIFKNVKNK